MATLNLTGASQAAQPNTTTGSVGRTRVSPSAIGRALVEGADLGAGLYAEAKQRSAAVEEAAAATRALDSILQDAEGQFIEDPLTTQVAAAEANVSAELGVELTPEQRSSMQQAALLGQRANNAIAADPSAEKRFNLIRTRELRNLIAKHPEMAREFRSLVYGSNNFITSLVENDDAAAAQAAKTRAESVGRVRNTLIDAGYYQVADLNDDEVMAFAEDSGYFRDVRRFDTAKRRADTLNAEYSAGKVVDDALVDQTVVDMIPGARRATMTGLDAIVNDPSLDTPSKLRAIEGFVLERRAYLADSFPMLGADEIDRRFGDVLKTIPDTYRELAGQGIERQDAENRLAVLKSSADLDFMQKYPNLNESNFVLDMYSTAAQALGPAWQVSNRAQIERALNPWLELAAANASNASPPQLTPTRRTDMELAETAAEQATFAAGLMRSFDTTTPEARTATAQLVVRGIEHPDNLRSDAAIDKWIGLLASPEFAKVAQTQEFIDAFSNSQAHRRIEAYLGNLDGAVGQALGSVDGKVEATLDSEGYLEFRATAQLTGAERDRVVRLSNRLRNVLKAQVNLYGITPEEATRNFYQEYMSR